jgi:hypothetical protein
MKQPHYFTSIIISAIIISLLFACSKENVVQNTTVSAKDPAPMPVQKIDTFEVMLDQWIYTSNNVYRSPLNIPEQFADSFPEATVIAVYINLLGRNQEIGENPVDFLGGKFWFISYLSSINTAQYVYFQPDPGNMPSEPLDFTVLLLEQ